MTAPERATGWRPGFRHHVDRTMLGWRCLTCAAEFEAWPTDDDACPGPAPRSEWDTWADGHEQGLRDAAERATAGEGRLVAQALARRLAIAKNDLHDETCRADALALQVRDLQARLAVSHSSHSTPVGNNEKPSAALPAPAAAPAVPGVGDAPDGDLRHNGHAYAPGRDEDVTGYADPRWCNTCGEAVTEPLVRAALSGELPRQDLSVLIAAVRTLPDIAALHAQATGGYCLVCVDLDPSTGSRARVLWPCPTARAAALPAAAVNYVRTLLATSASGETREGPQ